MSSIEIARPGNLPDSHVNVLETAWRLIGERGAAGVTLSDIAKEAGVSRQAIYLFFGGRAGLLTAMTRHHDATSGIRERFAVSARQTPLPQALTETIRTWFDYLPGISPVASALMAAAATDTDADARDAWTERMESIRGVLAVVAQRLSDAGMLDENWSVEDAADFIYAQAHYATWRHLVLERGWSAEKATERVASSLQAVLIRKGERRAEPALPAAAT